MPEPNRPSERRLRILILSQYYAPEPLFKMPSLARELSRRGHLVTVITGFPNYPTGALYPGYRLRWRQWDEDDGIRLLRLPLYLDHSRSAWRRSLNYLSFAASASTLGAAFYPPADILWTCPPLSLGIPAWWLSRLKRIPFVYEVQDMWPETVAATGMMSNPLALGTLGRLARFVYRTAAGVVVVSPGFRRHLIAKGVPPAKIEVIPNWADDDLYTPVPQDSALGDQFGLRDRFNVIYGGNLGAAQALENVLAAAARLHDLPRIQFVLIGGGVEEAALRRRTAELRLTNVRFIAQQPAEKMPYFFAWADVLLAHLKRHPLFEITIPGKTLAYLASGRPVLSATEGDAADVVREAGAGLVCPPEDPEALAQSVRQLYGLSAAEREALGQAGRHAFLRNFTRKVLLDRYEALLQDIVARSRPAA